MWWDGWPPSVEEEGTRRASAFYRGRRTHKWTCLLCAESGVKRYQHSCASWRLLGPCSFQGALPFFPLASQNAFQFPRGKDPESFRWELILQTEAQLRAARLETLVPMDCVRESPSMVAVEVDGAVCRLLRFPWNKRSGRSTEILTVGSDV